MLNTSDNTRCLYKAKVMEFKMFQNFAYMYTGIILVNFVKKH